MANGFHLRKIKKTAAGPHLRRLECTGKNEKSEGYYLGLDSFDAVVPVYERPADFDLRKIQKTAANK